jgi:hypothetical protein
MTIYRLDLRWIEDPMFFCSDGRISRQRCITLPHVCSVLRLRSSRIEPLGTNGFDLSLETPPRIFDQEAERHWRPEDDLWGN